MAERQVPKNNNNISNEGSSTTIAVTEVNGGNQASVNNV